MAFSTIAFMFAFLPIGLAVYAVSPCKAKNAVLVAISLVFYAWGEPAYIVLMVFSILFNYLAGLGIAACKGLDADDGGRSAGKHSKGAPKGASPHARAFLVAAVAADLLMLGFFKYYGFLLANINALLGTSLHAAELALPIGISFFTFSVISYVADVYNGKAVPQGNIIDFAVYVSFFPKVMSGPIVQYHDMAPQLRNHDMSLDKVGEGARLFVIGLGKKVLIADCLNATFSALSALGPGSLSVLSAWLGCACYTLVIYFDFSGYSDMAIGIAKMFGFDFAKNFDYPYVSQSATEFWRRWHISLGRFFRDYVYIPMGGNRVSVARHIRNISIVWLLTGFWHGAAWNFIAWGAFYGALLIIEKYLLKDAHDKIPVAIRHIVTMLLVMAGWVLFFSPSLASALAWLGCMLGIGSAGAVDATGLYYLQQSIVLIIAGAIGSTPLLAHLGEKIRSSESMLDPIASIAGSAAVLILSTAYMVNSTYSTFLYFKF